MVSDKVLRIETSRGSRPGGLIFLVELFLEGARRRTFRRMGKRIGRRIEVSDSTMALENEDESCAGFLLPRVSCRMSRTFEESRGERALNASFIS